VNLPKDHIAAYPWHITQLTVTVLLHNPYKLKKAVCQLGGSDLQRPMAKKTLASMAPMLPTPLIENSNSLHAASGELSYITCIKKCTHLIMIDFLLQLIQSHPLHMYLYKYLTDLIDMQASTLMCAPYFINSYGTNQQSILCTFTVTPLSLHLYFRYPSTDSFVSAQKILWIILCARTIIHTQNCHI